LHTHAETGPLERPVDQSSKEGSDISLVPTPRPTHFKQPFKSKNQIKAIPQTGIQFIHLQIPQHPKDSKQCIHISPKNKCSKIHSSPFKTRNRTNSPIFTHPHSKLEIEQKLLNSFIPTQSQKQLNVFEFIHPDSKPETTNDSKLKNS